MKKLIFLIALALMPVGVMGQDRIKVDLANWRSQSVPSEYVLMAGDSGDLWWVPNVQQDVAKTVLTGENGGKFIEPKAPKFDDKKPAPETVSIPKEREDKTRLFQAEVKNYTYELKEIEARFREIEAKQKAAAERWQIELISALKLAGVDEKDYSMYEYNQDTLTFTRKKPVAPTVPPK